ncbi:MAG: ATP-binding protein, partial [Tepidiformaceae bacterium]
VLQTPRALFDTRQPDQAPDWMRETAEALGLSNLIAVRLDADTSPVGMIAAGTREAGRLGGGELHILNEVAAPLAMLLERARVVTSLQQQTQRTRAVLDILAALGPRESMEEVAAAVANALRTMYAADHCIIATLEGERLQLAGIDSAIVDDWIPGTSIAAIPAASRGEAFPADGFQVTPDFQAEGVARQSPQALALLKAGLHSSMRVRIGPVDAPLGIVTVGSLQAARYTETDARELAQIVQPLGVAVNYFKDRRESEQRTLRLEYTNRILARLSGGGSVEHLAAGFLAECRTLFRCGHAVAMLVDPEAATARVLAIASDLPDSPAPSHGAMLPASAFLSLPDTAGPGVIGDIRSHAALTADHQALADMGLHSAIVAPLVVRDTVRGAVALWTYGTNAYTREDATLLATLTRPLAIALEKADAVTSLGESELKYRSLVAQAEEMIFLFDSETLAILDANAYTARTLGYAGAKLREMCITDLVAASAEEVGEAVRQTLDNGEFHVGDRAYLHQDGALIEVDEVASVVSYGGRRAILVLARDVSERKAIQRQLVQAQKMESLGSMAGAVAHDFNNLLTTILGFAGLLKRSSNFDSEERENLALIEDAARRAADLTGRLLAFARGGLVRVGPVDLRTVVADTLRLFEPGLHSTIKATTQLPAEAVIVEGDGGQLELALLNIVLNARDAMPDGGNIDIALSADDMAAAITIVDDGPGMDDETRMRIFEPFYTTKPLGSGTGLGMAITYGIVQGHHGTVELQTALGHGTRFTITLPLLPGGDGLLPGSAYNAGEGNLVLVVDDDELVRRTTSATLAQLGYNVVEAPGGATAVELVRARPDRFSAVLLDLVMPGMTGSETFHALTEIRPDLPVVVCTGYAADSHIDDDVKRRIAGLVQKPFTSERLSRAMLAAGALPSREAAR